jgi:DNA-binding CsgD family transcriptional regulator
VAWVGCHIDAYEQAKYFGDDLALKGGFRLIDPVGVRSMGQMMRQIGAGRHGLDRATVVAKFLAGGRRDAYAMTANHAYAADRLGEELGLSAAVRTAVLQTFERWDGKGAPSGAKGEEITITARIVNLADVLAVYHRPTFSPAEAAQHVRDEVKAGRLDGECVSAVLEAAGHPVRRRKQWPAGLTTREVEVLRLLARGLSNKQIAERLVVARKTVDNHIEHIYTKTGVSNRARASLFAVRQGLMSPAEDGEFTS